MTRSEEARRRMRRTRRARGRTGGRHQQEERLPIRIIICGVIFVLLVGVKLLFPQAVSAIAQSAGDLIGRNADFQAAFAAMGRAVSGKADVGDSLQDAYTAVFNPDSRGETTEPDQTGAESTEFNPGLRLLRYAAPQLPAPDLSAVQAAALDQGVIPSAADDPAVAAPASSGLTYNYQAPPDNASMEQRNLGFAHSSPLCGPLNSSFGWRIHPLLGVNRFHYGVDLGAPEGADIMAFADGEVYATGESSTLGNYIMIQHANGYITLYAHCSKVVATSGAIAMGQKIAEVGHTGQVTGPHLHFELHDGDLYLNPIYYVELA